MSRQGGMVGVALTALAMSVALIVPDAVYAQVQYNRGQSVQPAFDGYEVNADGTYTLWFAYMNRNYEEVVDVPVGPDNMFEPGPADRGQPTRFAPRRHSSVFGVVVPANFGKLTWHLRVRGEKASAVANAKVENIIDRRRSTVGTAGLGRLAGDPDNTPPTVTVEPKSLSVRAGEEAVITISGKDDGLPKKSTGGQSIGLTYGVTVYRGTGQPMIDPSSGSLQSGRVNVKTVFDTPGDYMLHVRVDDGSASFGSYCCWTETIINVNVK